MPHSLRLALLTLTCALASTTETFAQDSDAVDVAYSLRVRPLGERTVLQVALELVGDADGETRLLLPRCGYGTPDMHRAIAELWIDVSAGVQVTGEERERVLSHAPSAPLRVQYTVDWDPKSAPHSAYRPDVGPSHFHFFGRQWRVRVDGRESDMRYLFSFEEVPDGWSVFSNLGPGNGPWQITARDEELEPFVAGGDYATRVITLDATPVTIAVGGAFVEREDILNDVGSLACWPASLTNSRPTPTRSA